MSYPSARRGLSLTAWRWGMLTAVLAPLLASGLALGLATYRGAPAAEPPLAGSRDDYQPRPVQAVKGWLPAGRKSHLPAFDVRHCPALPEIYELYPDRDGIPALYDPLLTTAREGDWLPPQAPVLGLKMGHDVRCYPLAVLNWHSLIHDRVDGQAVYVWWDPPSGLALARRVYAPSRPLGLAGLGWRGMGLAYELATGALWDLFTGVPISFPGKPGAVELSPDYGWLPLQRMTWQAWRREHGETKVLSRDTGYEFDYSFDPYTAVRGSQGESENYWTSPRLLAPESLRDQTRSLPDKAFVLGFLADDEAWAVPLETAEQVAGGKPEIATASGPVQLVARSADDWYEVVATSGVTVPQVQLMWYAWKARFPQTKIYR